MWMPQKRMGGADHLIGRSNQVTNIFSLSTLVPGVRDADSSTTNSKYAMTLGTSLEKTEVKQDHHTGSFIKKRMSKQFSSLLITIKISTIDSLKIVHGLPLNGALQELNFNLRCQLEIRNSQSPFSLLVIKVSQQTGGMFSTTKQKKDKMTIKVKSREKSSHLKIKKIHMTKMLKKKRKIVSMKSVRHSISKQRFYTTIP